jgi:hypothetical protein
MDILYVIGRGSKKDNLELRMSLRSIARFGKNIGKVIVVGEPPKWLSSEVIKVKVEDKYAYKHSNILNCIERIVDNRIVEGDFLYSSDDHFYVKPVDFNNYPYYIKGELRATVEPNDLFFKYHQSLVDTRRLCLKYKLPTKNYSQHCNTHMHAEVIKDIKNILKESYDLAYGVEPTSIIMNAWQTYESAPQTTYREDIKIQSAHTVDELLKAIGDRESFSISDYIFHGSAILQFFKEMYGDKSKYERD